MALKSSIEIVHTSKRWTANGYMRANEQANEGKCEARDERETERDIESAYNGMRYGNDLTKACWKSVLGKSVFLKKNQYRESIRKVAFHRYMYNVHGDIPLTHLYFVIVCVLFS